MGQTLSEPVTTKESASCANSQYAVASSCMQGWRINMEDAHTHQLTTAEDESCAFFAVYDGHGGAAVSKYAGIHLHTLIMNQKEYGNGDIPAAIQTGFLALDERMREDEQLRDDISGTTAVVVLIKDRTIYCGNVGDSRAVASVRGVALPLSFDHKPANEQEAARIVAAGGWVEFNRVNGNLALSRALGDFVFKRNTQKPAEQQIVTAFPDVITEVLSPDHEFIVLACDGIWDVMTNQEVVDFVRERLAQKRDPQSICEDLLTRCLAPDCQMGGLGCDNMTVVLVCLLQGESEDKLAERCAREPSERRAASSDGTSQQLDFSTPPGGQSPVDHSSSHGDDDPPPQDFQVNVADDADSTTTLKTDSTIPAAHSSSTASSGATNPPSTPTHSVGQ